MESSMNCSTRLCLRTPSPPVMSWPCICIAAPKINALADEDLEQDPDRWCSHTANGQEAWQIISPWVWNLRLELGHQLAPDPVRTTAFAPALAPIQKEALSASPAQGGLGPKKRRGETWRLPHRFLIRSLKSKRTTILQRRM